MLNQTNIFQYKEMLAGVDGMSLINSTGVVLYGTPGDSFDEVQYDNTSINRGYITIWYIP